MHQNESTADRKLRLLLGIAFILIAFFALTGIWQILAYVVAAILIVTSATGYCALYKALGINTKKH